MKHTVVKTSDKNDDVKKRENPSRNTKMQIIFRELCFLLILLFTAYATIIRSNYRTKKSPPSSPFLGNANINDFYKGDLSQLMHDVGSTTFSFVFFYAPWDADCQDLRYEFLEAAEFYIEEVYFAGVNCWEPGSECRARFNNVVERYPQLVAYVGLERAVEYRGPHKADHIIKFLHSIIHPVIRLNSINDLWRIRHLYDAALVGYLNVHGSSDHGLSTLYETSLSLASRDHLRQIAVGVFTHNKSNGALNVTGTPSIHLYIWNKKFVYDGALKRNALLKWVLDTTAGHLVSTNGLLFLKPPVVVMFSPLQPLALHTPNYLMLQRVAMSVMHNTTSGDFEDCNCTFIEHNIQLQQIYYRELVEKDTSMRRLCSKKRINLGTCAAPPRWHNLTCSVQLKSRRLSPVQYFHHHQLVAAPDEPVCCSEDNKRIHDDWRNEMCRLTERTTSLPASIPQPIQSRPLNTSFSFASLDSVRFEHLAQALGIDILSEPLSTVAVIIGDEEVVKIGRGVLREERLWSGLSDWSQGRGRRAAAGWRQQPSQQLGIAPIGSTARVRLPELGLRSFSQLLQQNKRHSLILYYSHYCGACSRGSHILLQISHLLAEVRCLFISRIDGDHIDLPWHYSLHVFPSLLFLPAIRKSESRLFPTDATWSFSSISRFLLANVGIEERPEIMLALCARWGQHPEENEEGYRCIRETRKLLLDGIDKKLRASRHYPNNRKSTLHSLAFLKNIHLALARVVNVQESLASVRRLSRQYGLGCTLS